MELNEAIEESDCLVAQSLAQIWGGNGDPTEAMYHWALLDSASMEDRLLLIKKMFACLNFVRGMVTEPPKKVERMLNALPNFYVKRNLAVGFLKDGYDTFLHLHKKDRLDFYFDLIGRKEVGFLKRMYSRPVTFIPQGRMTEIIVVQSELN